MEKKKKAVIKEGLQRFADLLKEQKKKVKGSFKKTPSKPDQNNQNGIVQADSETVSACI